MSINLRPYQVDSIRGLWANIENGVMRQVLCAPTGGGKTEIAMRMIQAFQKAGKHSYFVCDRQSLVDQTSRRFHGADVKHGVLMGSQSRSTWHDTLVVSSQTLERRGFDWRADNFLLAPDSKVFPDVVIIDECHEKRKKILDAVKEHDILTIGLTATPYTKGLGKDYEAVVNVTSTTDLIDQGYLSPLRVVAARSEVNVDGLTYNSAGEWKREDLSGRVMEITGDVLEEWTRHTTDLFGGPAPTIVFTPSVADSQDIARRFQEAGHDFRVVHYKQSPEEKEDVLAAYRTGECDGVVSCQMLTRGFDAPQTRCLVIAYPLRKSLTMHIQMLGRVMRIAEGKEFGLVIDHTGNYMGFYADTQRHFDEGCNSLDEGKRKKAARSSGESVRHLKCKCGTVFPPRTQFCPNCGAERPKAPTRLVIRGGKLEEVDQIDGRGYSDGIEFNGDLWQEVCAVACKLSRGDEDRARRMAFAKFKDWTGRWPGKPFRWTSREPDPAIAKYEREQFRKWRRKQPPIQRAEQRKLA